MNAQSDDWLPPPPIPSQSIATGWKTRLILGKRGGALAVVANALIGLRHAPEWQGVLHFNESSLATIVKLAPRLNMLPQCPSRGPMSTMC
jgi:hypothetical protein